MSNLVRTSRPKIVTKPTGIIQRFGNWLSRIGRKSRTLQHVINVTQGGPLWSKSDMKKFAEEGYKGNPYVYGALNAITQGMAEAPPVLYRIPEGGRIDKAFRAGYNLEMSIKGFSKKPWSRHQCAKQFIGDMASKITRTAGVSPALSRRIAIKELVSNNDLERVTSHPILDVLARPNGWYQTNYKEFVEAFGLSMLTAGEIFTEPSGSRGDDNAPAELYILPATQIHAKNPTRESPIPGWEWRGTGRFGIRRSEWNYSPDPLETELFFNKLYDPTRPLRGLSPVEAAVRSIDLNNEARGYNIAFMRNAGVPPALITGEFDAEGAAAIEEAYEDQTGGQENAGRIATISGKNLSYHELSMDASDLLWGDVMKLSAREVSVVWGVPPEILGDSSNKTFCLPYESSVATPEGRKMIGDMRPGDQVYSMDTDTGEVEFSNVLWQSKTGTKQVFRVKGRGFSLEATGNHPVLTIVHDEVDNPRGGGIMFVPRFAYRAVDQLKVGDVVVRAHTYPDGSNKADHTEREMEFFGAMIGDGFAKDYGHATCVSMAGIKGQVRDHYEGILAEITPNKIQSKEREIRCSSKALVETLDDLNLTGGARTKRIPSWVFRQPTNHRIAFLRGLWDTDGSVDKNGRVTFHVANLELAKDVQRLCLSLGVQCDAVTESTRTTRLPNGEEAEAYLAGFVCSVAKHNLEIGSRDPSDLERMQDNASRRWKGRRMPGTDSYKKFMFDFINHVEFASITAIEDAGFRDVYDIEVEGNHNFFAENIVVHNSNYQEARKALYHEKILPDTDFMYSSWNSTWVRRFDDNVFLDYDTSSILAIQEDLEKAYKRLSDAKFLTINERRAAVGYEPTPGGNVILVSLTEVPLEILDEGDQQAMRKYLDEVNDVLEDVKTRSNGVGA